MFAFAALLIVPRVRAQVLQTSSCLILLFACVICIPLEKRCERMVAGIQCIEFLLQLNFFMACAILHSSVKFRFRFSSTNPSQNILYASQGSL